MSAKPHKLQMVRSRRRNHRKPSRSSPKGPSSNVNRYTGPLVPERSLARGQEETITARLTYTNSVLDSTGTIAAVLSMNPTSCYEWNNFVVAWDEYRVLATVVHWEPNCWPVDNSVLTAFAPLVMVTDRDSSVAPASYAAAYAYESAVLCNIGERKTISARMSGLPDAQFTTTAAPTAPWWHFLFCTGLAPSGSKWGTVFIEWNIQFRGRH